MGHRIRQTSPDLVVFIFTGISSISRHICDVRIVFATVPGHRVFLSQDLPHIQGHYTVDRITSAIRLIRV